MRQTEISEVNEHQARTRATRSRLLGTALTLAAFAFAREMSGAEGDSLWKTQAPTIRNTFHHMSDGAGGTIVAGVDGNYSAAVHVSRIGSSGSVVWGPVQVSTNGAVCSLPRLCSDGSGGALVAWAQDVSGGLYSIFVQRINSSGAPQWTSPISASNPTNTVVSLDVAAGNQGMFIIYCQGVNICAAHISAGGVLASPGMDGLPLGFCDDWPDGQSPCVVPDGFGGNGVIIAWDDDHSIALKAQRVVLSGGALSQAWGGGSPVIICNPDWSPAAHATLAALAQDGLGGALISWNVVDDWNHTAQIRVQKVNSSGFVQWGTNGVVLVDSAEVGSSVLWVQCGSWSAVVGDGSGGAYVAWDDWRNEPAGNDADVYAQRVDGSGVPQWIPGGISLVYSNIPGIPTGVQWHPVMISDLEGGALVTFDDKWGGNLAVNLVKLNSGGREWFRWVDSIYTLDQKSAALVYDATGPYPKGCVVAWDRGGTSTFVEKVQIGEPPPYTVTVVATDATAGEPGAAGGSGTFTFSRHGGSLARGLTVNFTVAGSATSGSDYVSLGTSVTIPIGSTSATKTVSVLDDAVVEGDETVILTLVEGTTYLVGSPSEATVTIKDDDLVSANDICSGALRLSENVYSAQNTSTATDDGNSTCLGKAMTKGVWFTYTPSHTGTAWVDTCPSDFDTMIEVFSGNCGTLASIACNDDTLSCNGSLRSLTNFACTAGTSYYIWAGGYNGASGNLQIRAYAGLPLTINKQLGSLYLYWNSLAGRTYTLQTNNNNNNLQPFDTMQTSIPATPPINVFGPITPSPTGQQFYRVVLEPGP